MIQTPARQPSILKRAGLAIKSVAMRWSGYGGAPQGSYVGGSYNSGILRRGLPGARYDYEAEAGPLWLNSAVAICLGWVARNFPEPRLAVERLRSGEWVDIPDHPILEGLETPNRGYDDDVLWAATALSLVVDGNGYWIKARARSGRIEYWYVPHWMIRPVWPDTGEVFISGYIMTVDGRPVPLKTEDVIHFRTGIDPYNERVGLAPLKACLREVCSDNEAGTYTASILRNMGIPGVVLSPEDKGDQIDGDDRKLLASDWKRKFTGEGRGEPLVMGVPIKVDTVGVTPEKMALDKIRRIPEARICAAIGLDPMVVGLSSGKEGRTYSNLQQANRQGYENCLMPLQKSMAKAIQRQSPDLIGSRRKERLVWDYSGVSALREDQTELTKRVVLTYQGGLMQLNEGRNRLNLAPLPGGDTLLPSPTAKGDLPTLGDTTTQGDK